MPVPTRRGERELVIMREHLCTCGCGGKDPWHKLQILRAVWAVRPAKGESYCLADWLDPVPVERVGIIEIPWGPEAARVGYRAGRWFLARTPEEIASGRYFTLAAAAGR